MSSTDTAIRAIWQFAEDDVSPSSISAIIENFGLSTVAATLLAARGLLLRDDIVRFLSPRLATLHDPFLLPDMDAAVTRVIDALDRKEPITVYGDYDVDGITSTTLLLTALRALGGDVDFYIPHRQEEGYGLHVEALRTIAARGPHLIIAADTGSTALEEAREAARLGLDLVVLDHHQIGHELPEVRALVNPQRPECAYPFREPAAVGVVFNLLAALRNRLVALGRLRRDQLDLKALLDLVALGTIADLVPLHDVNRVFAAEGVKRLTYATRPGVIALKEAARIMERIDAYHVGFLLAPRLNAGGRLAHARLGVDLFMASDLAPARTLAFELDRLNSKRQQVEDGILRQAEAMLNSREAGSDLPVIVLASDQWHPGVTGIVASRLTDRVRKPCFLIAINEKGVGVGSGRSVAGIDLHAALSSCSADLARFGGHAMAAGLTIESGRIDAFREHFAQAVLSQCGGAFTPTRFVRLDKAVSPGELTEEVMGQIEQLAPFGVGNPQPVFCAEKALVVKREVRRGEHLALELSIDRHSFHAIGFRMGARQDVREGTSLRLAYTPTYSTFGGLRRLELRIRDIFVL